MTNRQHRHRQSWMGSTECLLFRSFHNGAASDGLTLQASSPCLAVPQTPSERLKRGKVPCQGHIGNGLPCPSPVLSPMWEHYGCQADLLLASGVSTMDNELYWKELLFSLVITGTLTWFPESSLDILPSAQNSEATPRMLWLGGVLAWTSLPVVFTGTTMCLHTR